MKKRICILLMLSLFQACVSHEDLIAFRQAEEKTLLQKASNSEQLEEQLIVKDAIYTLVHVRQQHDSKLYADSVEESLKQAEQKSIIVDKFYDQLLQINLVQKEIFHFLQNKTTAKHRIYSEGMAFPNAYRDLFANSYKKERLEQIKGILIKNDTRQYPLPAPHYFLGASFLIHEQGERLLLGAEHAGILRLALSTYSNESLPSQAKWDLIKECHEQRENEILKNIVKVDDQAPYRERRIKFVIMGALHDFTNNVENWNKMHPLKKINLVTFTPESLREYGK